MAYIVNLAATLKFTIAISLVTQGTEYSTMVSLLTLILTGGAMQLVLTILLQILVVSAIP